MRRGCENRGPSWPRYEQLAHDEFSVQFVSTFCSCPAGPFAGLGCPVGAILVGDAPVIRRAHMIRKRLGGGMRQSGILAAAALHALDAHLARLADDHVNARALAALVDGAGGARVVAPDTNIVMVDLPIGMTSSTVVTAAAEEGVRVTPWSTTRIRAVTHLDVDAEAVDRAGRVIRTLLERAAG